ncbi:MAG TPA: family 43 glycosylhydrolase [Opitutaceae bacterium]|nr:family 43 glycosylhydrolase [Opitutaceae bacterium]
MKSPSSLGLAAALFCLLAARAGAADGPRIPMHDPVICRENGVYHIFATGPGIAAWSSPDLEHWTREKPVFAEPPAWIARALPTYRPRSGYWAPDISYHDGQYYLYYAVSAFGKNTSCIGLATNRTLDPRSPDFKWVDRGRVVQSFPGKTNWNAIDPNLATDEAGRPYLVFGSFWEGIKLARLTPDRMRLAESPDHLPTIASRIKAPGGANPPAPAGNPADAGGNAIEAPFLFRHGGWYYLFASIDYCCRGPASTYKMIVGRARAIEGPYADREGRPMARGGGDLLLAGDRTHWYAVGHCAVADFDGTSYLVFHGYDATDNGRSKLRIMVLDWDAAGWPSVGAEKY